MIPLLGESAGAGAAVDVVSRPTEAVAPAHLVWPMAFALQRCSSCGRPVPWSDAICEEVDGRLVAIRHSECAT